MSAIQPFARTHVLNNHLSAWGTGDASRSWIPSARAVIDRRLLINFRASAELVQRLLPSPLRPKLIRGWALAGICLLRLRDARPAGLPAILGLTSENAAHRIAVVWKDILGTKHEGVYVPRRDTASRFNEFAGGRVIPGVHRGTIFQVWEPGNRFKIAVFPADEPNRPLIRVHAHLADSLSRSSVFSSVHEAEECFRAGTIGWSPGRRAGTLERMALKINSWHIVPLEIDWLESRFFANNANLPPGAWEFDSAFLMREVDCEWYASSPASLPEHHLR